MSDTATVSTETATYRRPSGLNAIYQDSRVIAWRNLVHLPRTPQLVIFTLIQPIMFVLLFTYVFGGAIGKALPPGVSYAQFLIPGIMVQTLVFGTSATAVGLAEDLQNGIIDRFRSLPISRSAVLNGRILADMIRLTAVATVLVVIGYVVGFRFQGGLGLGLLMILVAVAFGTSMCWIMTNIGMRVKDAETAQTAGFVWLFPLTFISSVFTPVYTMPAWLQVFARNNPVTLVANLLRALSVGEVLPCPRGEVLPCPTWASMSLPVFLWIVGITAVAAPLAVNRYRQA